MSLIMTALSLIMVWQRRRRCYQPRRCHHSRRYRRRRYHHRRHRRRCRHGIGRVKVSKETVVKKGPFFQI